MSDNALIAVIAVCLTAIIIARIWQSTKHKYRR